MRSFWHQNTGKTSYCIYGTWHITRETGGRGHGFVKHSRKPLDNALEASIKEVEGYIDLTIKQEKNFLIFTIRNKCTDALEKEIDKSSKEHSEFHGIGLKSVKRTVKKYDGQINIEQTPQEFIVTIMIQNKQDN